MAIFSVYGIYKQKITSFIINSVSFPEFIITLNLFPYILCEYIIIHTSYVLYYVTCVHLWRVLENLFWFWRWNRYILVMGNCFSASHFVGLWQNYLHWEDFLTTLKQNLSKSNYNVAVMGLMGGTKEKYSIAPPLFVDLFQFKLVRM